MRPSISAIRLAVSGRSKGLGLRAAGANAERAGRLPRSAAPSAAEFESAGRWCQYSSALWLSLLRWTVRSAAERQRDDRGRW